jgi:sugar phosphate isomerase/epimerase
MLIMNWTTNNEGRLTAAWTHVDERAVAPAWLQQMEVWQGTTARASANDNSLAGRRRGSCRNWIERLLHPAGPRHLLGDMRYAGAGILFLRPQTGKYSQSCVSDVYSTVWGTIRFREDKLSLRRHSVNSCRHGLKCGVVLSALIFLSCVPLTAAGRLSNPLFVFEDGLGPKSVPLDARLAIAKKVGFDGVELDGAQSFAERLKAVDRAGLKLFYLYVGVDVSGGRTVYEPGLEQAIRLLKGRDTLIWLTTRGGGPGAESRAVNAVRRVSDWAAQSGLRVALYPHCGMYVARTEDALRIAWEAKRKNLGVTFNLCHWLMCDSQTNVRSILQEAMPLLLALSINGADHYGNWDRLIQPLGRGDFDVEGFLKTLIGLGYRGPVGLQCYQIPGDPETNLTRSMQAWRQMSARVAADVPQAQADSGSIK